MNSVFACLMKFCHDWHFMKEPKWAECECAYMSIKLRNLLRRHGHSSMVATCDIMEHHWVIVGEYQIDITARQFDAKTPWPLVWPVGEEHPCRNCELLTP